MASKVKRQCRSYQYYIISCFKFSLFESWNYSTYWKCNIKIWEKLCYKPKKFHYHILVPLPNLVSRHEILREEFRKVSLMTRKIDYSIINKCYISFKVQLNQNEKLTRGKSPTILLRMWDSLMILSTNI